MSEEANLIQRFKSNQGLSNKDLSTIFQVSPKTASGWAKGLQVDPKAEAVALALNVMMERWKKETGAFNDIDHQHLLKNAENLQKENESLKAQLKEAEEVKVWADNQLSQAKIEYKETEVHLESLEARQKAVNVANQHIVNKEFNGIYDTDLPVSIEVV